MSGSVEVRQFLLRYEGADGGSAPFAGALPAQRSGAADAQRVSDDQVRRARLAVANGALGPSRDISAGCAFFWAVTGRVLSLV